jgi:putative phosphoribosyl transferase
MVGGRTSNTRVIPKVEERAVSVEMGPVTLEGDLALPDQAAGIVLFAHGSGSGRYSPRNRAVAQALQQDGLGTLLIDLLTEEDEEIDLETRHLRFDIPMLAERLAGAIDWLGDHESTRNLPIGLFGASTGAGAALIAAVNRPDQVRSVVSRGGRPDLAEEALPRVTAPTLLIVGGLDEVVIGLNQLAYHQLKCEKRLEIIPGATHLFEEPGALEQVSTRARAWFMRGFGTRGD